MMHFVHTFSIMRAQGVRLIAMEEVRDQGKIVYIKNIFEIGCWEDAYPPILLSWICPGHKLRKSSKESGIFQSLGTISFFFLLKGRVKRRGHGTMVPLK